MTSVPRSITGRPADPATHAVVGWEKSAPSATTVAVAADFSPRTRRLAPLLTSRLRSFPGITWAISPGCECPLALERTDSFRDPGTLTMGETTHSVKPP